MRRRDFLTALGASAFATGVLTASARTERKPWPAPVDDPEDPLVAGEPVLMAPGETTMGVVWAVGTWATGGVEVGEAPDLSDARLVACHAYAGRVLVDDRVLRVRLTGLRPGTRYYYRTVTLRLAFRQGNYNLSKTAEERGRIHSFTTYGGASASGRFVMINDTHQNAETLPKLFARIAAFDPEVTIWTGDGVNGPEWRECAVEALLTPKGLAPDYAASRPLEFVLGNHEHFGSWASAHLDEVILPRLASERAPEDELLCWNHAFRQGPVAFLCLDTGADKPDTREGPSAYGALRDYSAYRVAQAHWLERQFVRPEIASAPYVIAVCHIPLQWGGEKGGDATVWSRESRLLWEKVLDRHGVQLVMSGHTHASRVFPSTTERRWVQLVGGGPRLDPKAHQGGATVVTGEVRDGALVVSVENAATGRSVDTIRLKSRI